MNAEHRQEPTELYELALTKTARVLGPERARSLLDRMMAEIGLDSLRSPEELLHVAQAMTRLSGFERAVGAMLGVDAVMRGAAPPPR